MGCSGTAAIVVGVFALVLAGGGAIQVARIGHSGAKAVWNDTRDGDDDDDDRDDGDNSGPGSGEDRDD